MADGSEPLEDEELVYRRIPVSTNWYDPQNAQPFSLQAFRPRDGETGGLSLVRAKYKSPEEAARNNSGRAYWVAALSVGTIRALGMEVVRDPLRAHPLHGDDPSHVQIPQLMSANRRETEGMQLALAEIASIIGRFPPLEDLA
jgi:hypothetical protein